MSTVRTFLALVVAVAQLAPSGALAAEKWFLLARHGECFPVRSLERKFPDIDSIAEPDAFIKFALAKGLKVTSKAIPLQAGSAVEVLVPERELSLVFVTAQSCSKVEAR
jgi:hypothetical protein